jgi:heptosyltransferase-2
LADLCSTLSGLAVIPYKRASRKQFAETIATLRSAGFAEAFVLPISFSSAWCAFRIGIPKRRGVSKECRRLLLTEALPGKLRDFNRHLTHEYAAVLKTPYQAPEAWQGRVPAAFAGQSNYQGAIVFCPGAKYGPAKRWPWFGELAPLLSNTDIVLLGDREDAQTGASIEKVEPKRIKNLIGKTTLTEALSIIAGARLVVSNDSGLMHLAGFLGTPLVAIFGSTSPTWTRPLGNNVRMAGSDCDCSPCFSRTCRFNHYYCQKNISPVSVAMLAGQLLPDMTQP